MRTMGLVALVVAMAVAGCGGGALESDVSAVTVACPPVPMDALQCGAPGMTPVDSAGAQLVICTAQSGARAVDCNVAGADGTPGTGGHCVAACPDGLPPAAPFACQADQQVVVGADCGVVDGYGARVYACTMTWGRECSTAADIHCMTGCPIR